MKKETRQTMALILFAVLTVTAAVLLVIALNRPLKTSEGVSILELLNTKIVYALYVFGALLFLSVFALVILCLVLIFRGGGLGGGVSRAGGKGAKGKKASRGRFVMLSALDAQSGEMRKEEKKAGFEENADLPEICENFRNYAAGTLGLYYSLSDIRRFIAGLGVSKLVIMQGMSGTGKTSLAYAFGKFLENGSTVIPIQPMWKERADMIGYFNEFTGKFNETLLLRKMYEARYSEKMYVTVLDEMNIARVEYYFSEFLSLLELPNPSERLMEVVSDEAADDPRLFDEGRMVLPDNMWFIGTANNDDSTFAISDKVYDRAMIMNLDRRAVPFLPERGRTMRISAAYFNKLAADAAAKFPLSREMRQKTEELDAYLIEHLHVTFGNRIMKQTELYASMISACGGREIDAIDDILCKKVLRKLEAQNPVFVKSLVPGVLEKIDELFGAGELPLCRELLDRYEYLN